MSDFKYILYKLPKQEYAGYTSYSFFVLDAKDDTLILNAWTDDMTPGQRQYGMGIGASDGSEIRIMMRVTEEEMLVHGKAMMQSEIERYFWPEEAKKKEEEAKKKETEKEQEKTAPESTNV